MRYDVIVKTLDREFTKPYEYGKADCFFLGCAMADALAGTALCKTYADAYSTLQGAQKALRKRNFTSMVELFATHFDQCAPAEARMGDIVILQIGNHEHVGICLGSRFITKTDMGKAYYTMSDVKAAFRVGKDN